MNPQEEERMRNSYRQSIAPAIMSRHLRQYMADLGIDAQSIGSLKISKRPKCAFLVTRLATLHYKDNELLKPRMICNC